MQPGARHRYDCAVIFVFAHLAQNKISLWIGHDEVDGKEGHKIFLRDMCAGLQELLHGLQGLPRELGVGPPPRIIDPGAEETDKVLPWCSLSHLPVTNEQGRGLVEIGAVLHKAGDEVPQHFRFVFEDPAAFAEQGQGQLVDGE